MRMFYRPNDGTVFLTIDSDPGEHPTKNVVLYCNENGGTTSSGRFDAKEVSKMIEVEEVFITVNDLAGAIGAYHERTK